MHPVLGEGALPSIDPVGDDTDLIPLEGIGDLRAVGLHLPIGALNFGVRLAGPLQFKERERQPVDKEQDIGAPHPFRALDGELVDGSQVVRAWVLPVDEPSKVVPHATFCIVVLDRDSTDEVAIGVPVFRLDQRRLGALHRCNNIGNRLWRKLRVELLNRGPHSTSQDRDAPVVALRRFGFGVDAGAVDVRPVKLAEDL